MAYGQGRGLRQLQITGQRSLETVEQLPRCAFDWLRQ